MELPSFINIQTVSVVLISILIIYILIYIYRRIRHHSQINHHHHNKQNKNKNKTKCGSDACLDKYNYVDCPCHKKNNKPKELFTMAQSVFPLDAPTIPAFSQIVNENMENMANITKNFMEMTEAHPLTREYPSKETSTGFFNVVAGQQ